MSVSFRFTSDREAVIARTRDALHAGLEDIGQLWLTLSILRTPVDSGVLRASLAWAVNGTRRHTATAENSGEVVSYEPSAPPLTLHLGSNAAHAAAVHEMPDAVTNWSARGTGSKYIETPLRENEARWRQHLADRLREGLS